MLSYIIILSFKLIIFRKIPSWTGTFLTIILKLSVIVILSMVLLQMRDRVGKISMMHFVIIIIIMIIASLSA